MSKEIIYTTNRDSSFIYESKKKLFSNEYKEKYYIDKSKVLQFVQEEYSNLFSSLKFNNKFISKDEIIEYIDLTFKDLISSKEIYQNNEINFKNLFNRVLIQKIFYQNYEKKMMLIFLQLLNIYIYFLTDINQLKLIT